MYLGKKDDSSTIFSKLHHVVHASCCWYCLTDGELSAGGRSVLVFRSVGCDGRLSAEGVGIAAGRRGSQAHPSHGRAARMIDIGIQSGGSLPVDRPMANGRSIDCIMAGFNYFERHTFRPTCSWVHPPYPKHASLPFLLAAASIHYTC